jgi:hypothetical protein
MPRFCTAALLVLAALAGPVGTLVCRLQCVGAAVGAAVVAVHAPGPCHGGSPNARLRANATPCDERVGPAAVKPERFEPASPAVTVALSALREPRRHASPAIVPAPSMPLPHLAFVGTDLPLRI